MNMRNERLKLRIKNHLMAVGRAFEAELYCRVSNYSRQEYTAAVNELAQQGFLERATRSGASVLVLTGAPLEDLLQDGGSEV